MMPSRGIIDNNNRTRISPARSSQSMRKRRRSMNHALLHRVPGLLSIGACLFAVIFMPKMGSSLPLRPPFDFEVDDPGNSVFFANDTLLGGYLLCTKEEKECLRYNRIFFPPDGRCYPLGDGPAHCRFAVDRCEFEHRGGHIRGECVPTDICRPLNSNQVLVAYNGACMKTKSLLNTCGPGPVNLIQHFFGGTECIRPQGITPSTPVYIPQPEKDGWCVFPNLRHDMSSVANEENHVHFKACSRQQSACFSQKQVWNAANRSCSDLLKPCVGRADASWVALNRTAWGEGRVEAACVPVHPCGKSFRLMAFDRRCYDATTVLRVLCPGGALLPNAFGEMSCVTRDYYRHVIDLASNRPESCEITQKVSFAGGAVAVHLKPECGLNKRGRCVF